MPATLLKTKLYIPPARPRLVRRPQLVRQLDDGLHRKLTLISAPPGFGKTTLLSEWAHRQLPQPQSVRVAWFSLDQNDNDPIRFWHYAISALNAAQPSLGADALSLLTEPQAPPIEEILTVLINSVAGSSDKLALVLDDYHLIETELIHQALTFFLDHLPPQLHLIITSRSDPPLPLTRLRVRNQLTELRDADLRFTPAEAAVFLNQIMNLALAPEDMAALESRTEGWIAGLQLAALSMQGRSDTHSFVKAFTGSHRYIIDYLAEEVLAQQPPHIRTFLLHTSILARLSGPLCDALLERSNGASTGGATASVPGPNASSQEFLEYLDQANLFVIPLDGHRRWYRYHHLFADFLAAHLRQTVDRALQIELHRRAGCWYASQGLTAEAVNHALDAGDTVAAVRLIESVIVDLLASGEVTIVLGWLARLPDELVLARPRLALGKGWSAVLLFQWAEVEKYLTAAEAILAGLNQTHPGPNQEWDARTIQNMQGEAAAMRAMLVGNQGNRAAEAVDLCEQALAKLPTDTPNSATVRSIIYMTLGGGYEALGNLEQASVALENALKISLPTKKLIISLTALSNLARLHQEQGQLYQAAAIYNQAIDLVEQRNIEQVTPFAAGRWAYVELAELYREWNDLEEAKRLLTIAIDLKQQLNMLGGNLGIAYLILARVLRAEGDLTGALEAIQQAREVLPPQSPAFIWVEAVQAQLWLAQGKLSAAAQWAQNCNLSLDTPLNFTTDHHLQLPGEYLTLARILVAQEQFEPAAVIVARLKAGALATGRNGRLVEILVAEALLQQAQGQTEPALATLAQAVALAQPGGYIRVFADEGRLLGQMLQQLKSRSPALSSRYVDTLLNACLNLPAPPLLAATPVSSSLPQPGAMSQLIEPLSDRELEVLQLVAEGLSNREIAEKLYITVGTAKTHTINIYRKLEVNSRTQAVARAQELGLI